jgi:hypothetical protein
MCERPGEAGARHRMLLADAQLLHVLRKSLQHRAKKVGTAFSR